MNSRRSSPVRTQVLSSMSSVSPSVMVTVSTAVVPSVTSGVVSADA